ncbi:hypothetical protein ACFWZ6_20020 [Streptomyces massasporeus]
MGEEPTSLDLDFFWERRDWLTALESALLSEALVMFLYAEGISVPRQRPWWQLLNPPDVPHALVTALINLPSWLGKDDMARPLEPMRVWAASGRVLIASLRLLPEDLAVPLTCNIWDFVRDEGAVRDDPNQLKAWSDSVLVPVLAFAQNDLLHPCSQDCARVMGDNPHEVESLRATDIWGLLVSGEQKEEESFLVFESIDELCAVGVDVTEGCPLVVSNRQESERIVRSLHRVIEFRSETPDGASRGRIGSGEVVVTLLENHGMAWRSARD